MRHWLGASKFGIVGGLAVLLMMAAVACDDPDPEPSHPPGELIWSYETDDDVRSSPVVVDGVVYAIADASGSSLGRAVYALDALTGELIWSYETDDDVPSSLVMVDGVVYVGSNDDHVYALDALTGELIWSYGLRLALLSSPAVADGMVYVSSNDGHVYALDALTGELIWSYGLRLALFSSPAGSGATRQTMTCDPLRWWLTESYTQSQMPAGDRLEAPYMRWTPLAETCCGATMLAVRYFHLRRFPKAQYTSALSKSQ